MLLTANDTVVTSVDTGAIPVIPKADEPGSLSTDDVARLRAYPVLQYDATGKTNKKYKTFDEAYDEYANKKYLFSENLAKEPVTFNGISEFDGVTSSFTGNVHIV